MTLAALSTNGAQTQFAGCVRAGQRPGVTGDDW